MRPSSLALTKALCIAAAALASSACGGGEGLDADPDLDVGSSDTDALLQGAADAASSGAASGSCQLPDGPRTVDELKGSLEDLPVECVPAWTQEQLNQGFARIRDERLLTLPEQPDFPRRLPWLGADNGCEERAEAANYFFDLWHYPTPYFARVLAKKDKRLVLVTDNVPEGKVVWGSHVAPVVRVDGELIVLDPAVEPERPLPIAEWIPRFSVAGEFDVALCRDRAQLTGCFDAAPRKPSPPKLNEPDAWMHMRLTTEWGLQEILGRDPYRLLGDCPPWLPCAEPEPTPDPDRPPTIRTFRSHRMDIIPLWSPIYVVGSNFVEGLTTVRITGAGVDELAPIDDLNMHRILITKVYDPGDYQVTAYNGAHASQAVTMTIE
ncbi:protein-glutamine glutaminase family protein [Sorangium sp. So ce233]|uniref:protein-glutamine glutaminase family protein n=1 Tax=Sorangium sp. So ce233 TaxID=3133290 RepID=UPI003F5E60F3